MIAVECIGDNTVVEFVEGKLSVDEAAQVEEHLSRCTACRKRVIALGTSPSRLANAPTPPAGVGAHLTLQPGMQIGRFTVKHEIGRGGMGVVFAAYDDQLRRNVAIKLLRSASFGSGGDSHRDLLEEARVMARLDHANIVTVYEAGTFRDETYLVMELVDGTTLSDWLRRWGPRPWTGVLDAFRQAGRALAHAHGHGLAHGDLKPENILIDDSDRVRVTDFGLARHLEPGDEDSRPGQRQRMVMGTPRYMAPEQFIGYPADARSDQFGFCVAFYEALYGQHPFAHDTSLSLLRLWPDEAVRTVPADTEVPAWVQEVLQRGLSGDPADRFGSMDELLMALTPPLRRHRPRWFAAAAACSLMLLCVFAYALVKPLMPTNPEPPDDTEIGRLSSRQPGSGTAADDRDAAYGDSGEVDRPATEGESAGPAHLVNSRYTVFASSGGDDSTTAIVRGVHDFIDAELRRIDATLDALRPGAGAPAGASAELITGLLAHVDTLRETQAQNEARIARLEEEVERARGGTSAVTADRERRRGRIRRGKGLSRSAVDHGIRRRWRDLEICFREWRERQPRGRDTLALEFVVDRTGRARTTKHKGIRDKVVVKCVSGALEAARFPKSSWPSVVSVGFRSRGKTLRMVRLVSKGAIKRSK